MDLKIAVVIPTIRAEQYRAFRAIWADLFHRHDITILTVYDEERKDKTSVHLEAPGKSLVADIGEIMGDDVDLITHRAVSVRNLGYAYIAKYLPKIDYILNLDDDELPIGDTIQDHLNIINQRVPVSWMAVGDTYTRGFPYGVRDEAEVVLSHGVWEGVADLDAQTQLDRGNHPMAFYRMPVPKGVYFPMCGMNVMIKRCLLPHYYMAPEVLGVGRGEDIFCGILCKRVIDARGWAAVTGYARTHHIRASNALTLPGRRSSSS
jgi:hypothetical protein